jgi:hypothetical protein
MSAMGAREGYAQRILSGRVWLQHHEIELFVAPRKIPRNSPTRRGTPKLLSSRKTRKFDCDRNDQSQNCKTEAETGMIIQVADLRKTYCQKCQHLTLFDQTI